MNRYENYQDSGIQWLGEVPKHWKVTALKFYYDVQLGKMLQPNPNSENDFEIPYLKAMHIQWDRIQINDLPFMWINSHEVEKYSVQNGDLLVCEGGEVGRCSILNGISETTIIQNALHRIRASNYSNVKYLDYIIRHTANAQWFSILCNKATIAHLTSEKLINLPILIPPLPEQTAIADYLDNKLGEIDALISKQETLLAKLAEQRTAMITHAVTKGLNAHAPMKNSGVAWLGDVPEHWEIIKNKFILEFSKGLTITKENLLDEGIPCVNYGEIHSKYGFEVNPKKHILKCVSEEYLKTAQNALLENGDFVFADTSEDIKGSGNFTYLSDDTPVFAGYHTIIAKPNRNKIFPRFLAYVFESGGHRNQIREIVKGVKVFSITQAFLKNTFVWLPPFSEQTTIADYLDEQTANIDRLSDTVNQTIASLKEYRSALITQAVTGKIKVI